MRRALVAAMVLGGWGWGCGAPCERVRAEHDALLARTAPPTATPHARVQLPYVVVDELFAQALREPVRVPLPVDRLDRLRARLGLTGIELPPLTAVLTKAELGPAAPGHVRVYLTIEIADDAEPLVTVRASAEVAPVIEHGGGHTRVSIAIRPEDVDKVEPDLSRRSTERIAAALARRVPAGASAATKAATLVAGGLIAQELGSHAYELLRATVLPRVGEVTRIGVELPEVPVATVVPRSGHDALELDVMTTLPVAEGVRAALPALPAGAVGVQVAGSAAAALGNWGIASGHLPQRYTRGLKPAADGAYVPFFDWRAHTARPLAVHMFKHGGGCAHFAVGMQPHVDVEGDHLRGWLTGRELEHADAPLAFELLARLNELFESSTTEKQRTKAVTRVTIGGRAVEGRVVAAAIDDAELDVALALRVEEAPKPAPPAPAPAP